MVTKGLAAPEVGAVSTRAHELCRQVGETPQLFLALQGAQRFYLFRAELRTARELAERLIPLAQRAQDSALLPEAHAGLGAVLDSLGELVSSRTHLEQAITLYDTRQSHSAIARVGMDLGVASLPLLAQVLWLLGYPDQALTRSRAGLTLAQEIAHPFSTAAVWTLDTGLHQFLHEARTVQQQAEAVIALSNEQGFSLHFAQAITRRGLGTGHAGAGRRRHQTDTTGPSCRSGYRDGAVAAVSSRPAGRGVRKNRTGRGRVDCAGRGAGFGEQNWGAYV